ncbi:hypothetical protein CTT31_07750 [Pseudoalteromonas maricaloris]|uniref:hypothetical protein n=1 Tax=Pseudoalteromonas maricaloris TaxID=184924 RepID=UPI0021AD5DD8|nr:hypothetical protein [Pseudoalteromonas flavipulchra]USE69012.1 hypothetical protein CTT31_07750 [Pseudoalteromonas flavipulchra]
MYTHLTQSLKRDQKVSSNISTSNTGCFRFQQPVKLKRVFTPKLTNNIPSTLQKMNFGPDTGADNDAEFYLYEQKKLQRAREAERLAYRQKIDKAIEDLTKQYNHLASGNWKEMLRNMKNAVQDKGPGDGEPKVLMQAAINEMMSTYIGGPEDGREKYIVGSSLRR